MLDTFKKVEDSGLVPLEDIFRYTFEDMPKHLQEQLQGLQELSESGGTLYGNAQFARSRQPDARSNDGGRRTHRRLRRRRRF
ncbi:MAG: hypothetical protein MZU97_17240 [Bacillus subtilis]|nr:hypothetical protein [Bacillus subtilis]